MSAVESFFLCLATFFGALTVIIHKVTAKRAMIVQRIPVALSRTRKDDIKVIALANVELSRNLILTQRV